MNQADTLSGRAGIVTGGANGLGLDIATGLVWSGACVIIAGRNSEAGETAARQLGPQAAFIETDITDDAALDRCVAACVHQFGKLDILVNNACDYRDSGASATRSEWLASLNVNLVSGALLAAKAAPCMQRTGGGTIINISSIGGKSGRMGSMLYPAAKAALLQITRNQAVEFAPIGIRVLSVSPAWTWSPAVEKLAGSVENADRVGASLHPRGRIGRGSDVANAVVFACSDAADFMTGTDLPVDGGYSVLGPDQGRGAAYWFQTD